MEEDRKASSGTVHPNALLPFFLGPHGHPAVHTPTDNNRNSRVAISPANVSPGMRLAVQMTSACVGSLITSLLVTPLDVVKVRLQAMSEAIEPSRTSNHSHKGLPHLTPASCSTCSHYSFSNGLMEHVFHKSYCRHFSNEALVIGLTSNSSITQVMSRIVRTEGFPALWDGLAPTLVMAVPSTVIYMVMYDDFSHNILPSWNFSQSSSALLAGGISRVVAGTLVAPFELIRTQMQSSQEVASLGMRKKFLLNIKENGVQSLWRGLTPTLMRDVPFSILYWGLYEEFRKRTMCFMEGSSVFMQSFISGAAAGGIAAFATTPFDVIKTRQQVDIFQTGHQELPLVTKMNKSKGTFELLNTICREEGFSRLFTGVAPRVVKVAPACAIMIGSYDVGKAMFGISTYQS
jgi:solute carrier family 25, member 39/40